ncbi:beta-lactamase regulating signal transducer with metallopeptidase domain [Roseivirga pacifica]|uniref:Signal transducer regulating beta-lactamase production, contains metallopeptidase domain n=1 Tax=Roseivirga pacifica TaxID=1267423 RepID=A0A1I0NK12_9BACT|nr:M56 family metallopeptidase [Roseivirga pacifica]RKQ51246.1 beta-lactamase regulating signal transducer with metallopeptidase domain [Roseivirga pacifica]SEW01569.1 Signal transducer regulating beta-lactamase production, contains metallopeptidase domain [Roseivirga pacifica]
MNTLIETSQQLLNWSIQAGVTLLLLFACYYLLFRNNTALKLRRSLLLSLVGLSLLAPFIELPKNDIAPQVYVPKFEFTRTTPNQPKAQVNIVETNQTSPVQKVTVTATSYSTMDYIAMAFAIGAGISAFIFMLQLIRIYWLVRNGTTEWQKGTKLVKHSLIQSPFSFLNWIFVPTEKYDNDTWKILMAHEHAHLQQKHSLDILFTRTIATLTWYNPAVYLVIQELRQLHESLADEQVLKATSVRDYSKTLLAFSFDTSPKLAQAFSLKTSIKKRLTHMQQTKTNWKKTVTSSALLIIICITLVGAQSQTVINEQAKKEKYSNTQMDLYFNLLVSDQISIRHEQIFEKLQRTHPNEDILIRYESSPQNLDYQSNFSHLVKPLYFGELSQEDKDQVFDYAMLDTRRVNSVSFSLANTSKRFSLAEIKDDIKDYMDKTTLFVVFYHTVEFDETIYSYNQVDTPPAPAGGLEAFQQAIALDNPLPKGLSSKKLPEYIEFSAIVDAHSLGNLLLVTELEGTEDETLPYYRYIGKLLTDINEKSRRFYKWKLGVKDGKEVKTRIRISIPTKYIQ